MTQRRMRGRSRAAGIVAAALLLGAALVAAAQGRPGAAAAAVPAARGRRGVTRFHEPAPLDFNDHTGYISLFDGHDLKGWDGDPTVWSVKDGAITGVSTPQHRVHTYLVYRGLKVKNFDLKLEIKAVGGGTGIQYRSVTGVPWRTPEKVGNLAWMMTGPQADFWSPVSPRTAEYTGQFYVENSPMGIVAWRGEVVEIEPGKEAQLVGTIGNRKALGGFVNDNNWNQYEVIARGGTFIQIINGQLMSVAVDDNPHDINQRAGMIGIEIEGAPSVISVRNIWLKKFPTSGM